MATIADTGFPNIVNVAKRLTPTGAIEQDIAEVLNKNLELLEDIPWIEGNLPTGHRITSRNALPSMSWRKLNQGLDPVKSETLQYDETCGILEAHSKIDVDVADLNGNTAAFRMSEDKAFIEAMSQEFARALFYESVTTNPERIHGLASRYAQSSGYTASSYVLPKGTLSGTNCESVWLVTWEEGKIFGIYPKGSKAGLSREDLGRVYAPDANSKQLLVYASRYQWKPGLAVKDYRYGCRMQWDPDDSSNFPDTGKNMYLYMQQMLGTVYRVTPNTRFYMSRTSFNKLSAQLASNSANFLEYVEAGKRRVPSFLGVPVRVTDALVGESAIS
jgi:hypothetical protein